jgi:hypothetical protein
MPTAAKIARLLREIDAVHQELSAATVREERAMILARSSRLHADLQALLRDRQDVSVPLPTPRSH